jgi:hypothetical protein
MTQQITAEVPLTSGREILVENACYHCGSRLNECQGCDADRCLTCEPYLSDDCAWAI